MRKVLAIFSVVLALATLNVFFLDNDIKQADKMSELRKQHEYFLRNSPFKEILNLSKAERIAKGIPPNKYLEREWELTMNPAIGKPEPAKLFKLQEELRRSNSKFITAKVPGEKNNDWIERGPNNVGGRTRAIMFDPNDAPNYNRVFAGGVSGGLWVNDDITNASSTWTEVDIPQNLTISCIAYDPNNTNIFYVGTGESYVGGDVNGNGVWQSNDAGATWSKVFGGTTGETTFVSSAQVTVNSPGSIAGNYIATIASFGATLTSVSGNLVLVDDGTPLSTEGCSALTNGGAINGNIAVVERGNCNFTVKVKNAQDAGAIAVLVINNVSGPPFVMGGEDATVTIPSVMVSKDDGQAIIAELGSVVNITMQSVSAPVTGSYVTSGIQHINDIKVRDVGSTSEVYVAAATSFYADANPSSIFGIEDFGLYRSTDNGSSWSKLSLAGASYEPNDIEVAFDNSIWISTTSNIYGQGGGTILSSPDGITYTVEKTVTNGSRTQIAMSSSDADKLYVIAELTSGTNGVEIIVTDDGFSSETSLPLPDDTDTGIPATDFTRGQAFYDLMLEVDPTNDAIVYIGGIDLFRSDDSGASWVQISKWSNNNYLNDLAVSLVHADQHAFVFHPTDNTKAVVGNDGGVYYATALSSSPPSIDSRNTNYNTVQFYKGGIGQDTGTVKILGGAQDNGVLYEENATSGLNGFDDINNGGDGAYVFIDKNNEYLVVSYVYNNYNRMNYADGSLDQIIYFDGLEPEFGSFINPAALDSDTDYLYTNGTPINTTTYQIFRFDADAANPPPPSTLSNAAMNGAPTAFKPSPHSSALFVGTDNGKLFKLTNPTSNANQGWLEITGDDFYGSISCIELGEFNDDKIYVSFHNYGVTNVFYSADGGSTWQNKEGDLPDLPVKAIMPNPLNANEVILGTELGVWATPNFGDANPNWYQAQNGMKDVKVTSFDLRTADNTVLASTYGRGMFTGQFTAAPSTLSIEDDVFYKAVKVYPTVSDGSFKIASNSSLKKGAVKVFNINGQKVYDSKIDFNKKIHDVDINVSSGLYLVEIMSGNLKTTKKIVIK